ncbi:purine nucleoside phosphorylase [Trichomonascus vanleenenianus]|uniref:purine-nucleoside phosphorylase n=1 Tax=Trichomonascus vanleenenianus TaxID=2268995 RepID=UPI003ECA9438
MITKSSPLESDMEAYEIAQASTEFIRMKLPEDYRNPSVVIVCGSGLSNITNALEDSVSIPYSQIPHFKESTVAGHAGKLVVGKLNKVPVVCMSGRLHTYEGHSITDTVFPIRVLSHLTKQPEGEVPATFIATNAAGGLNKSYRVGSLMVLNDDINFPGLAGLHPLKGPNDERYGPRFLPMSDAYDQSLRQKFFDAAEETGVASRRQINEGVYAFVSGPTYETRAESRMLIAMGADAVGMSTVPEIIVARHSGMRTLAVSLITNVCITEPPTLDKDESGIEHASHAEVIAAADEAAKDVQAIITHLITKL